MKNWSCIVNGVLSCHPHQLMSKNAGGDENGDSGEISSVNLTICMQITSTEIGLTCCQI